MDFNQLMNAIGVKLSPFEIKPGVSVYIKLPSITKYSECLDPYKTIFYCVVDEDGKQIFESPEQVENSVDLPVQVKLNQEIGRLFTEAMDIESVESK
ncbi:hypothetical protein [Klebsiella variicola]|uniref:hypothetical protein n=1 Tax=Klebsiella variicola TaxID=244366 RepID=UPI0011CB2C63|nr:hypothetical protein [Klebsiella variicola]